MSNTTAQVDGFIRKHKQWKEELQLLRELILESGLTEQIKWRQPCYTYNGQNVVILSCMKDSCTVSFLKGALLKDPKNVLQKPGPNSQAARVVRFTDTKAISKAKPTLKALLKQAIAVEKSGKKIAFKKIDEHDVPDEFKEYLDNDPALKKAYESLTPGRRRAYLLHFSGAKQSKTRTSRVEKCIPKIMDGKGLND